MYNTTTTNTVSTQWHDYKYMHNTKVNFRNVAVLLEDGLGTAPMLLSHLNDLPVY